MLKMNFKADISNAQLDSMHARQRDSARSKQPKPQYKQIDKTKKERQAQCGRCGDLRWHSLQQCPAREVICNNCRKKGHYARVCKTKRMCEMHVATVVEDTGEEVAFLGSLSVDANGSPWMTDIHVENLKAVLKLTLAQMSPLYLKCCIIRASSAGWRDQRGFCWGQEGLAWM